MNGYETRFMERMHSLMCVCEGFDRTDIERKAKYIKWDGFIKKSEDYCCQAGNDNYYVYVWMHLGGEPFYVGSGKGNRWLNRKRRIEFLRHLDQGDAVVYKVLSGVDKQMSLMYERYISFCFSWIRDSLVNRDNNILYLAPPQTAKNLRMCNDLEDNYFTYEVEKSVAKIIEHNSFSRAKAIDILAIQEFRRKYGETYFSDGEKCWME